MEGRGSEGEGCREGGLERGRKRVRKGEREGGGDRGREGQREGGSEEMRREGREKEGRERGKKWQDGCQVLSKFGHMGSKSRHITAFIKSLKRTRK